MRLFNVQGKLVSKNVNKYLIKWDGLSPSKLQFNVKQFLKTYWKGHIVFEEFICYGTRLRVDFLNATRKISIEVNGSQHDKFNKFFHQNRGNFLQSIKRDMQKYEWLQKNEFKIIELDENDIFNLSREYILKKFNISI